MYKPQVTLAYVSSVGKARTKNRLQSSSLEEILVIFLPSGFSLLWRKTRTRLVKSTVFVNQSKLFDDMVVESARVWLVSKSNQGEKKMVAQRVSPVQHDHEHIAHGGESLETRLRVAVRLELAILESTNLILIVLVITIEDGQV